MPVKPVCRILEKIVNEKNHTKERSLKNESERTSTDYV